MASYQYFGDRQNWMECYARNKTLGSACVDFLGCKNVISSNTGAWAFGLSKAYGCENQNFPF